PLDRPHVEDLGHERVARLGALDRDGTGRAVDPREVDLGHEVVLAPDLAGEAVVRLEGDDVAGLDLQHGPEVGPERPDDVATWDSVLRHRASPSRPRRTRGSCPRSCQAAPGPGRS